MPEKNNPNPNIKTGKTDNNISKKAGEAVAKTVYGAKYKKSSKQKGRDERKDDFEQRILDLARVTRVMAGGKRMRFRACVAIGDKKGKVSVGIAKGADVTLAVNKAVNKAKKDIVDVPMINETIPHTVIIKFGAAKIMLKPAKIGKGVIAGGIVRVILELAGIKNITSKIYGTSNKVNNAKATIEGLKQLRRVEVKKNSEKENKEKEQAKEEVKTIDKKVEKEPLITKKN